jgi:hypothetical protein
LNCVKGIVWHGNVTIYFGKRWYMVFLIWRFLKWAAII